MVANPWAFDPIADPQAAFERRKLVLLDMLQQHDITRAQYEIGVRKPLPKESQIQQPQEPPAAPYFTSWLRPQIIDALEHEGVPAKLAPYKAYYGGLRIRTSLDLQLQQAAQQAVDGEFPPGSSGPTAALVAIDNRTGEVRAMVSGDGNYSASPFNLATLGYRQPGSSFKPFTLAEALRTGEYGPYSIIDSAPQNFIVPGSGGKEHFIVHNFGNTYSGAISLAAATAISDNSVFSQVGIHVGTSRIARLAAAMGIRSPVSHNYAMILGGLKVGVSPLDMAHAYETLATGGLKVYNPLLGDMQAGDRKPGPTGIAEIRCSTCPLHDVKDHPRYYRVIPASIAHEVHVLLEGVVGPGGTGGLAAIPGVLVAGKTGTTSNYADAWFVGWTPQLTTAVWVGYPRGAVPMTTAYNGQPVEGGTFPALIWNHFMVQALNILAQEQLQSGSHQAGQATSTTTAPYTPSVSGTTATAPSQSTATISTAPVTTSTTSGTATAPAGQPTTAAPSSTTPLRARARGQGTSPPPRLRPRRHP
jgi:penicillin-binding protein 1A